MRCERAGNIVTTKRVADDAPIIAMFERDPWHSFFDVPTLLVWADGTIFYSEGEYAKTMHFMSSTTASSQVAELSDEIISKLRDAPAETSISDMTDEPSVQLIFRDGAVWRSVDVYGLDARLPETDIPAIARNAFSVYHQLLEWRPSNGQPAPTSFPRPSRWPADLPTNRGQAIIDKPCCLRVRRRIAQCQLTWHARSGHRRFNALRPTWDTPNSHASHVVRAPNRAHARFMRASSA